jgi:hypothetical protein
MSLKNNYWYMLVEGTYSRICTLTNKIIDIHGNITSTLKLPIQTRTFNIYILYLRILTINYQLIPLSFNFTLEATMGGIILEHVDHVVQSNEWIIDGNNLKKVGCICNTV